MTKATTGQARALIALALVTLTVLAVVVAGVLLARTSHLTDAPFSLSNSGQPVASDAERHEVVAVAEQFCLRMDSVDASDADGYKKRVSELLTTKQKAKFESEFARRQSSPAVIGLREELAASGLRERDPDAYRQRTFELSVAGYFADPLRARDHRPHLSTVLVSPSRDARERIADDQHWPAAAFDGLEGDQVAQPAHVLIARSEVQLSRDHQHVV